LSAAWAKYGESEMSVAKTDARHLTKLISVCSSSDGRGWFRPRRAVLHHATFAR
jgi:hypothetical protein